MLKRIRGILLVLVISLPLLAGILGKLFGFSTDVALKGYTDAVEETELTAAAFYQGTFQQSYEDRLDSEIPLRGVLTKTYSTIRYNLFQLGNRPIGTDGSIYEPNYLNAELNIGEYSGDMNRANIEAFVDTMTSVQTKLETFGKKLYVYVAPSKAGFDTENLPVSYAVLGDTDTENTAEILRECLEQTSIPYLFCSDLADELEYPAFYYTGIHWSRTYEQYSDRRVIRDLSALTGLSYRSYSIDTAEESSEPFFRDTDVYDLLNVWNQPDCTFYQYDTECVIPENYDRMRIFMYGDSFGKGLLKDVEENNPGESIYYLNYYNYLSDFFGTYQELGENWDNLDWQTCLDNSDVVVIEMTEPEIKNCSLGFADYLNGFLDTYVPGEPSQNCTECLDASSAETWDTSCLDGVWGLEDGFAWTTERFAGFLQSSEITEKGLEISFSLPDQVIDAEGQETVSVYVNGTLVCEQTYDEAIDADIRIPADRLPRKNGDVYEVLVVCGSSFNPSKIGESTDDRELGVRLHYMGVQR